MNQNALNVRQPLALEMPDDLFLRFSRFIYEHCRIKMSPAKKVMLKARLTKRLRHLAMTSFEDYYGYVTSKRGLRDELEHMINVVTTNKTDFFREPAHFDVLMNKALPAITQMRTITNAARLNVWSAGCSSGEEPYTLSMFLWEFFGKRQGDFSILASDISTRVLDAAKRAIYTKAAIEPIPDVFRKKYLMRGKGSRDGYFRIMPELRKKVLFRRINLLEKNDFNVKGLMDIIFCRNVIIYFDRETQITLFKKFYAQLRPGGFMFVGHSETLNTISNDFVQVDSAVYQRPG